MLNDTLLSSEQLCGIAGKSFARYLGYPDTARFLEESVCMRIDLTHDRLLAAHLSDRFCAAIGVRHYEKYSDFLAAALSNHMPRTGDHDPMQLFSREALCARYQRGERFVGAVFSFEALGLPFRAQFCCELYEENGAVCGLMLIADVTELHDDEVKIMRRVEFDGLTGLYNRSAGDIRIVEYFRLYPHDSAAVLLIDLDFFKRFNDQYGHDTGDAVLRAAAHDLEKYFARDSVIVRNGGDEFLVLLKNRSAAEAADEIGRFSRAEHVAVYKGQSYRFTFSVGYALYPDHAKAYHELAMKADVAMYTVKMHHRNSFAKYHPDMLLQKRTQLGFNLADIVSGIPGAILVYKADEKEEILFANDQLYDLFACDSMEELLQFSGDSFRNIVHPDDLERVEEEIWAQIHANPFGLDYVSYRIITKTGQIKMIDDIGHLVHTPKYGDIFYVFLYDRAQKDQILRAAGIEPEQ